MSKREKKFSEFSYGFSFLENMIRENPGMLEAAPCFPSQYREKDLGYDVKIDAPGAIFFFQFKVPEKRTSRAREINQFDLGDKFLECHLNDPYLRMPIRKDDNFKQHMKLMELEASRDISHDDLKIKKINPVFYATPMFISVEDIDSRFGNGFVHHSSAFFSPCDIGPLISEDYPFMAYNMDFHSNLGRVRPSHGWICSNNETRWDLSQNSKARAMSDKKYVKIYRFSEIIRMGNICVKKNSRSGMSLKDEVDKKLKIVNKTILRSYLEENKSSPLVGRALQFLNEDIIYNDEKVLMELNEFVHKERGYDSVDDLGYKLQRKNEYVGEFPKLYELQSKVRSYFGAELVVFQRKK